jgi:hypothetical protein
MKNDRNNGRTILETLIVPATCALALSACSDSSTNQSALRNSGVEQAPGSTASAGNAGCEAARAGETAGQPTVGGTSASAGERGEDPESGAGGAPGTGTGSAGRAATAAGGALGAGAVVQPGGTPAAGETGGARGASGAQGIGGLPGAGALGIGGARGVTGTQDAGKAGGANTTGIGGGGAPGCLGQALPEVTDFGANGPYQTTIETRTGPNGDYTLFRPATLGENAFRHPIASWGNGITTSPDMYTELLSTVASHGFVVIASNSTSVTADLVSAGLDWMVQQNSATGVFQEKLASKCLFTIGYSLGGGAAVDSGGHADVVATVSFHGLQGAAEKDAGPLLLLTSTSDGFVTKAGYVQPCYDRSTKVPTIMATLEDGPESGIIGHLYPLGNAGEERAPAIAWLRMWGFNDRNARKYFYGTDCLLCKAPWAAVDKKNADWD